MVDLVAVVFLFVVSSHFVALFVVAHFAVVLFAVVKPAVPAFFSAAILFAAAGFAAVDSIVPDCFVFVSFVLLSVLVAAEIFVVLLHPGVRYLAGLPADVFHFPFAFQVAAARVDYTDPALTFLLSAFVKLRIVLLFADP